MAAGCGEAATDVAGIDPETTEVELDEASAPRGAGTLCWAVKSDCCTAPACAEAGAAPLPCIPYGLVEEAGSPVGEPD